MKKIALVLVILVIAIGLSIFVFSKKDEVPPAQKIVTTPEAASSPSDIINNSFSNLDSFTAGTLDGGTFTSEDFKGYDLTIVNIWGTFCGPCREEMPELASFANSLPSRIQFITICTDASGNTINAKSILSSAGFNGKTLVSGDTQFIKLLNKIQYVPTTLFFDAHGICVGNEIIGSPYNFSEEYRSTVNAILAKTGRDLI